MIDKYKQENKHICDKNNTEIEYYKLPNGLSIRHLNKHETDFVYNEVFEEQVYLKHGITINDGDCVFDIGANIGMFSLFVQQSYRDVKIYAVEPAPELCEIIKFNTSVYNSNVTVLQCGASNENKEASFTFYPRYSILSGFNADDEKDHDILKNGLYSTSQEKSQYEAECLSELLKEKLKHKKEYKCQLKTISSIIQENNIEFIDLLKIDVEKSELEVLNGIDEKDWKKIKQIVIEVHDCEGKTLNKIKNLLWDKGFGFEIEEENCLKESGIVNIYAIYKKNNNKMQLNNTDENTCTLKNDNGRGEEAVDKIVVCGTFTTEPLIHGIEFWKRTLEMNFKLDFTAYNQVFQELLIDESSITSNTTGMNVILLRFDDWLRYAIKEKDISSYTEDPENIKNSEIQKLESIFKDFIKVIKAYASKTTCFTFMMICPPSSFYTKQPSYNSLFKKFEEVLADIVKDFSWIEAMKVSDYHSIYNVNEVFDDISDKLGHIPYTTQYYNFLSTLITRRFYSLKTKPYKVITLDCDNTLWDGICGEVGWKGIKTEGIFDEFHNFLKNKSEEGLLLCLCSKNNEQDVWDVFDNKEEMILKKEHIVDSCINWQPKSENIKLLSDTLNLGVDSFIFIDDNPVECAEVRANSPETLTLQWSDNISLKHIWVLDNYTVTDEDRKRQASYKANVKRKELMDNSYSFEDFIKSLKLSIKVEEINKESLNRVSQLTKRTNQFNFTTKRRSPMEIQKLTEDNRYGCWTVEVKDRFGEYGIVGVMITRENKDVMELDTFLLSCRVLGRAVEYKMMAELGTIAKEKQLSNVRILYSKSKKNHPARQFLSQLLEEYIDDDLKEDIDILIPAEDLSATVYKSAKVEEVSENKAAKLDKNACESYKDIRKKEELIMRIATQLNNIRDLSIEIDKFKYKEIDSQIQDKDISETNVNNKKNIDLNERELYSIVLQKVKEIFGQTLSLKIDVLDETTGIEKYVREESLKIVEITSKLNKEFNNIVPTMLFEHKTLKSITENIIENNESILKDIYDPKINSKQTIDSYTYEISNFNVINNDVNIDSRTGVKDSGNKRVTSNDDIAIIGINGKFPQANNLNEFWKNLRQGVSSIREIPKDRWKHQDFYDKKGGPGKAYCKWGGFIDNIDCFEASFFHISPREAETMDPQQRLFMEVVWGLLEDAGYTPKNIARDTGVFVGVIASDYNTYTNQAAVEGESGYRNSDYYQIPNRISYFFDFHGPSVAIDTACSSAGAALHIACQSLKGKECKTAIVGGLNLFVHPGRFIQYSQMQVMSLDNKCRPFGNGGTGTIYGEGIGALLLKPLNDAKRDGDQIYGVIKGSAMNSGGKTNGFTVPNPLAQGKVIAKAIQDAKVDPRTISYIEAHGTGTPLGDPIEIRGLTKAFYENSLVDNDCNIDNQYCAVGSVKSNIGHLESGAAVVGIIKILLQMKNKEMVPSLNSEKLNPMIDFENTPFYVQHKVEKWKQPELEVEGGLIKYPRRAGISSFGAGGVNTHFIIEEYEDKVTYRPKKDIPHLIVISANNKSKLDLYIDNFINFLKENIKTSPMPRIESIAYTLQVGRSAMEERIALVAVNLEDIIKQLSQYRRNKRNTYKLYTGNIKKSNVNSSLLLEGREGKEYFNIIINDRKLEKLAQLWVSGVDIDWELLYSDQKPPRISLPTYKFKGDKYWIKNYGKDINNTICNVTNETRLHPMIDDNHSTFYEQCFKKTFSKKDLFIKDHIVNGDMVLPGVTYFEIAKVIGNLSKPDANIRYINNIVWTRPVIISEDSKEVFFSLYPQNNHINCKAWTILEDTERLVHAEWNMKYEDSGKRKNSIQHIDIENIKASCNKHMNKTDCYSLLQSIGYNYGSSFQVVEELHCNIDKALAHLKLKENPNKNIGMYPSLMDGALQAITGWINQSKGMPKCPYVPFTVGEIEILGSLTPDCYAVVTHAASMKSNDASVGKYDVKVLDIEGKALVIIKDYYPRAFEADDNQLQHKKIYYKSLWERQDIKIAQLKSDTKHKYLIFDIDNNMRSILTKKLKQSYETLEIILVKPGKEFKNLGEKTYAIDPRKEEHYKGLIKELKINNFIPHKIIHLWANKNLGFEVDNLEEQLYMGLYSIQYLSKSIIKQKLKDAISLIFAYVNDDQSLHPQYAAVNGMLRSIQSENSRLDFKSIEFPYSFINDEKIASIILDEFKIRYDNVCEIKYDSQNRYIKRFKEFDFERKTDIQAAEKLPLIKDNGVYLITGGTGGLGLVFTEYLAKHAKSKFVLTGRSKLNFEKKKKLSNLQSNGAEIVYIKADISRREEVCSLISQIKARFNSIDGIIHMAGVIRDSLVINKTQKEIDEVIAPKVWGTIFLDEETKNENLDFFVLFSSTSSVIGHIGQSDYAYANRFLDEYSALRKQLRKKNLRTGKTLSINWSWWKNGGMKLGRETQELLKISYELKGLETQEGLNIFKMALSSSLSNFMIIIGNSKKVSKLLEVQEKVVQNTRANEDIKENEKNVIRKIKEDIGKIVSDILKMPTETIDFDRKMSEFGFDSITFTTFANQINQKYSLNISPAVFYEYPSLNNFVEHLYDVNTLDIIDYYSLDQENCETVEENELYRAYQLPKDNYEYSSIRYTKLDETINSKYHTEKQKSISTRTDPVAIIGMGGVFPKCNNLQNLWKSLEKQEDLISEIPKDRWDWREYYGHPKQDSNKTDVKWGGFMQDVDKFDALFFGISPREATFMDPQQRIFMETVWKTVEDAGYKPSALAGSNTGVFVGASINDYNELIKDYGIQVDPFMSSGINNSIIANRVSYLMDLHGPSEVIDTACSSSLVAIKHAVDCIRKGECDMAIVGGVNVILRPKFNIAFRKTGMLSPDGRCKTFDKDANGYARGEGAGAIILKPLSQAEVDGDHIYGVIKGTAQNHGGYAQSLTAPNPKAQAQLLIDAYEDANMSVDTVGYIEAHGTGTSLGDPIEINGLKEAFSKILKKDYKLLSNKKYCGIGSIKTNIGHLEAASGIAGIIKVLLAIQNKKLPGNVHFKKLNPYIKLEDTPFYILEKTKKWEALKDKNNNVIPRRAGVSSFGFGGTNAHVVIEEYESSVDIPKNDKEEPHIIVISAKDEERLKKYAYRLTEFLGKIQPSTKDKGKELGNDREAVEKYLITTAAKVLKVDENYIDINESIEEYGFDIFNTREFLKKIRDYYGINIDTEILTQYTSLYKLSEYIRNSVTNKEPLLQDLSQRPSLADIAFTLQLGREAMNERMAIVVSSIGELKEILEKYSQNMTDSTGVFRGSVKRERSNSSQVLHNVVNEQSMQELINNGDLDSLANIWVTGVNIDWSLLHKHRSPLRVSLPTYPFARKRCWLPEPKRAMTNDYDTSKGIDNIHPLISRNKSTLNRIKFSTLLTGKEFYLTDHLIDNRMVLPGVTYIEMARAAGEFATERKVSKIKNIIWARPIAVDKDDCIVTIDLKPEKDSLIYEIRANNKDNEPVIHGQGKLFFNTYTEEIAEKSLQSIDIQSIKNRCFEGRSKKEFYELFEVDGAKYGPRFQAVKELYHNKSEALAYMVLPSDLEDSFRKYVFHPSLMDGALQAITGLISRHEMLKGAPYLPFNIGEIKVLSPLTTKCYVYVSLKQDQIKLSPSLRKYNILITNDRGEALVKIKDFTVRSFKENKQNNSIFLQSEDVECLHYYFEWEKELLNNQINKSMTLTDQSTILIWTNSRKVYKSLNRHIDHNAWFGRNVIWVQPGEKYISNHNKIYEVNPMEEKDFIKLVEDLKCRDQIPDKIISLWSQDDKNYLENLEFQIENTVYPIFYLNRQFMIHKPEKPIDILYLYLNLTDKERTIDHTATPFYSAISSLAKTVELENSKLRWKAVEILDSHNSQELSQDKIIDLALRELENGTGEKVRYVKGQRYVEKLKEFDLNKGFNLDMPLKEEGVYIITGGMGGLGRITASYLAKKVNARMVLVGRSELTSEKEKILNSLESMGAKAIYIKADISHIKDVEKVIKGTKERFNSINGIFHCAGLICDGYLANKPTDDFRRVFTPKIQGLVYLDELTKKEKLDVFVLFSSISAVMGNTGQSDYAYANGFMDSFCDMRENLRITGNRFGRTISINWPLWQEGGMSLSSGNTKYITTVLGMALLDTKTGVDILEKGMLQPHNRFMVVKGDTKKLKHWIKPESIENGGSIINEYDSFDENIDIDAILKEFQGDILNCLSDLLQIPVTQVKLKDDLSGLGLSSLIYIDLANQINEQYELEIIPSMFFEHSTPEAIINSLFNENKDIITRYYSKASSLVLKETAVMKEVENEDDQGWTQTEDIKSFKYLMNSRESQYQIDSQPIAIIGLSGMMPESKNLKEFWNNLVEGKDLVTEIDEEHWESLGYKKQQVRDSMEICARWGGFLKDVDKFDAEFFNISKREADLMDPQQRIFLETVWKAIEDAGYRASDLSGTRTGLFVGVANSDYYDIIRDSCENIEAHVPTGIEHSILANRISYLLNLHGPSEPINTACSSSLVAIHRAVEVLRSGDCSMAVAGGVNVINSRAYYFALSKAGMLSPDGRCKTFDKSANGYVRGEGSGAIILKPLNKALKDGDYIYGVIKGSAVNHGGRASSLTAPNSRSQADLLIDAYTKAKIDPDTVSYIEAHGTGTELGDPIEIEGLKKAFDQLYKEKGTRNFETPHIGIGAVKTNIGHLESAAGIAGVIKVLLAMKHKKIPGNLHFHKLNPYIQLEDSPFYIVDSTREWEAFRDSENRIIPRRAGISSFGFGGVNAHLILEEYKKELDMVGLTSEKQQLIVLSAKNESRLKDYAVKIKDFISNQDSQSLRLEDIAYTLQVGREPMNERVAFIVNSLEELREKVLKYSMGEKDIENLYKTSTYHSKNNPELPISGKEGEDFIKNLAENRRLHKIAQLWVDGVDIDFKLLHKDQTCQRVPLPSYPFERKRYWFVSRNKLKDTKNKAQDISVKTTKAISPQLKPYKQNDNVASPKLILKKNDIAIKDVDYELKEGTQENNKPKQRGMVMNNNSDVNNLKNLNHGISMEKEFNELHVKNQIKRLLSDVLYIDNHDFDENKTFLDLGLDSILAIEMVKKLNEIFKISIKTNTLYSYPTVNKLSKKLTDIIVDKNEEVFDESYNNKAKAHEGSIKNQDSLDNIEVFDNNDDIMPMSDITLSETSKVILNKKEYTQVNTECNSIHLANIKSKTKSILKEVLYVDEKDVDDNRPFLEQGLDSILAIEMVKKLNEKFNINIKTNLLYSYPNINELVEYLSTICHVDKPCTQWDNEKEEFQYAKSSNYIDGKSVIDKDNSFSIELSKEGTQKVESPINNNRDIAVIGMSGQFPGAKNVDEFWDNLVKGVHSVKEIPKERWDMKKYYDSNSEAINKTYNKWGGFLDNADKFDSSFFNISPSEAEIMDPQQRLFLQEAWKAIEDAGYSDREMDNKKCGVFVGVTGNDYLNRILEKGIELPPHAITANAPSVLASRISYYLNLRGASFSLDAACSSSFMAIDMACESISKGKIDMALVGGVNVLSTPYAHIVLSKANMLSKSSQCKSFDEDADGFVLGEAVGAVLLKSLDAALKDNDNIYGIIKTSGVNQNGRSNGIVAPNAVAQEELIREIYGDANISPNSISYIEAHGTGSKLGDSIEVSALEAVYKETAANSKYCGLGSIKTNVGHTLGASGIVSLIKVLMSMKYNKLPGILHFKEPNKDIDFENSPFYVNIHNKSWQSNEGEPKRAAINSFGINGTNSHIIVEEALIDRKNKSYDLKPYYLVQLSAKTEEALNRKLMDLAQWLTKKGHMHSIGDVAYTLFIGRSFFKVRCAFIVKDIYELTKKIKKLCKNSLKTYELMRNLEENPLQVDQKSISAGKELLNEVVSQSLSEREYYDKLNILANLFIKGYDMEWDKLYSKQEYYRVSLPSYPFERESYWIDKSVNRDNDEAKNCSTVSKLHPFIDVNESTINELCYKKVFTVDEFFLRDHKAGETKILPGVAYLEMARAAGSLAQPQYQVKKIKDVTWLRALDVEEDKRTTFISLYPNDKSVEFKIYTLEKDNERLHHAEGSLVYKENIQDQDDNIEKINIEEIKSNCIERKNRDQVCDLTQTSGMNFGPTFSVIQELYRCKSKALTYFELPKEIDESFQKFIIHPTLVDAAIQTTVGLKEDTALYNDPPELPFMLEELEIIRPLTKKCYALAVLCENDNKEGSMTKCVDISITDEFGHVLVKMKNYYGRPFKALHNHRKSSNGMEGSLIEREKSIDSSGDISNKGKGFKIKDNLNKKVEEYLKEILSKALKLPAHKIQSKERLERYGIDSLMIIKLNKEMEKHFGKISKTLFFEYQTLGELSEYFIKNHKQTISEMINKPKQEYQPAQVNEEIQYEKKPYKKDNRFSLSKDISMINKGNQEGEVAIIGISGKYPFAENVNQFWENLKAGKDCVTEIPSERWDYHRHYHPDPDKAREGKSYCKWGAFVDDVDKFDPLFFRISPAEAETMDPQERVLLQTAWETIEDAGYTRDSIKKSAKKDQGADVGVFIGSTSNTYLLFGPEERIKGNFITPGTYPWSLANRISYLFNFNGPSFPVDTGCSSALIAIHLACESIKKGECQYAIAGGVNLYLHHSKYNRLCLWRMLSPTGKCHTFGDKADGFVPGEGVGTILLKPLSRAIEDKDHIYAVIKSSSANHDGRTNGYTVPSPNAQADVIRQCLNTANINARALSYVEAHGTGTLLGDPIEITGLTKAFREYTSDVGFCSIGSSKSNIGHLEGASGIGGLTKIILQMKHKKLVPSLHSQRLNPNIDFDNSPFYVQQKLTEWNKPVINENGIEKKYPRLAGISAFGAGGANAHLIVQEYEEIFDKGCQETKPPYIIVLSGRKEERVASYIRKLLDFLKKNMCHKKDNSSQTQCMLNIDDIAYTLQVGREAMEYRIATLVSSIEELIERLQEFCQGNQENFYTEWVGTNKAQYDFLVEDEEGKNFINTIINNRKLDKIAKLWVSGIEVDWKLLYGDNEPRRISLPTYSFAKESYWVKVTKEDTPTEKKDLETLHPMVGQNISVFTEQRFSTVLTGAEFYLADHIIDGEKILPGVAYIEMVRAAGEIAGEMKVKKVSDIVWMSPIAVGEKPQEIYIGLYPHEDNVKYEIYTIDYQGQRLVHSQGKLVYCDDTESTDYNSVCINIQELKNRCSQTIDTLEHYKKFEDLGLKYGKTFKTVKELYSNKEEALSHIISSENNSVHINKFTLNPSLMDGALHSILSLIDHDNLFLPFAIGEVEIIKPIPNRAYSYARLSKNFNDGVSKVKRFDVTIMDEEGNICVNIKDFSLKLLDKNFDVDAQSYRKNYTYNDNYLSCPSDEEVLDLFKNIADGNITVNEAEYIMEGYE